MFGRGELRRLLAITLTVISALGLAVVPAGDAQASTACSTTGVTRAYGGVDSDGNLLISTPEQLAFLATEDKDWANRFKQTADIDLRGCNWQPIGANATSGLTFNGDYDGAGFSITNFFIDTNASGLRMGLFGITRGSTITNLRLQGSIRANSAPEVGALVGKAEFTTISRVKVDVNVEATGSSYVGGIVGNLDSTTAPASVSYSSYRGTISGKSAVGGIAGYATTSATMSNNYVFGTISTTTANASGGVVGTNGGIVVNSYAVNNAAFGLSGQAMSEVGSSGSFWDKDLRPTTTAAGSGTQPSFAAGKTAYQLKMIETYTSTFPSKSWDIVNGWEAFSVSAPAKIWGICSGVNDGYPFLLWEYTSNPCATSNNASGSAEGRALSPAIHLDLKANVGDQISGRPVEIAGTGLGGGSAYSLVVRSSPTTIKSGSASGMGNFSNTLRMPALPAGTHTLTLTAIAPDGSALTLTQTFTVSAAGVVTSMSDPVGTVGKTLAETGSNPQSAMWGWGVALLLIAAGVAMRATRKRFAL